MNGRCNLTKPLKTFRFLIAFESTRWLRSRPQIAVGGFIRQGGLLEIHV